jgi:L-2,4-diaminobutyrate decarboxylase
MKHSNSTIEAMFDPAQFATLGHALIDILTRHLETNLSGTKKILNWQDPETEDLNWQSPLPKSASHDLTTLLPKLEEILQNSLAIHHPHNMGHQVSTPLPLSCPL